MNYKDILKGKEYSFLARDEHLGRRIILLGLAGSYAYGTNNEDSDIDIRGVMLNRKSDLIGLTSYEQYVDNNTDTVIYTFNKIISLFLSCNPNTVELLGLKEEHYLYFNDIGRSLLHNKGLFLSKRAIQSFGGYADAQLRRLENALARDSYSQSRREEHILNSIRNSMHSYRQRYTSFENGGIRLYIDKAISPDLDTEIFMDVSLTHYPLRDYKGMWSEMHSIVKDYDKLGRKNGKKDDNHLNKHSMHLVRLFMMALDILEKGEINTYRQEEHELLVSIRRGDFQKADGSFRDEFYQIVSDYERRLAYAAENTPLPDEPDFNRVQEYVMWVNERVVRDEI